MKRILLILDTEISTYHETFCKKIFWAMILIFLLWSRSLRFWVQKTEIPISSCQSYNFEDSCLNKFTGPWNFSPALSSTPLKKASLDTNCRKLWMVLSFREVILSQNGVLFERHWGTQNPLIWDMLQWGTRTVERRITWVWNLFLELMVTVFF